MTGFELSIRLAVQADARALALVGGATMLETYAALIPGPDIVAHAANKHSEAVYAAWIADPKCRVWLAATPTGAAIGYLVLTPATLPDNAAHPEDLEVQRIYVMSRFHGAGIGHRLMATALAEANAQQARQVVLGVLKLNERAVAFYRRQGFSLIGARKFQVGASEFDDFCLWVGPHLRLNGGDEL